MVDVHVVSNIDGLALEEAFLACDPATTLIAVASKTFTTIETMTNAASALAWLADNGVADPYGRVIALTASPEKAVEWGVDETRVLPFSQSVGGRYSLCSSIGFPVALAVGWQDFAAMLDGAARVDEHFRDTDGRDNLPLRAAFADLDHADQRRRNARHVRLRRAAEAVAGATCSSSRWVSNGKRVTAQGDPVDGPTAPIIWGGVGTDAQHAVFQLLHQGTHLVAGDLLHVGHRRVVVFLRTVVPVLGQDREAAGPRLMTRTTGRDGRHGDQIAGIVGIDPLLRQVEDEAVGIGSCRPSTGTCRSRGYPARRPRPSRRAGRALRRSASRPPLRADRSLGPRPARRVPKRS